MIKQTHTFAKLKVSQQAYEEIEELLRHAGYDHAFIREGDEPPLIDMHGIALERGPWTPRKVKEPEEETRCRPHGLAHCPTCFHPRGD